MNHALMRKLRSSAVADRALDFDMYSSGLVDAAGFLPGLECAAIMGRTLTIGASAYCH